MRHESQKQEGNQDVVKLQQEEIMMQRRLQNEGDHDIARLEKEGI